METIEIKGKKVQFLEITEINDSHEYWLKKGNSLYPVLKESISDRVMPDLNNFISVPDDWDTCILFKTTSKSGYSRAMIRYKSDLLYNELKDLCVKNMVDYEYFVDKYYKEDPKKMGTRKLNKNKSDDLEWMEDGFNYTGKELRTEKRDATNYNVIKMYCSHVVEGVYNKKENKKAFSKLQSFFDFDITQVINKITTASTIY